MPRPLLVVVSGPPGAGKTSLAQRLADDLRLPLLNKDGFKETLFDSLGWSDLDWSRRLGAASMALLFHTAGRLLAARTSLILEANFRADLSCQELTDLQRRHQAAACQILCYGDADVFVSRFRERNERGQRHPGHVDQLTPERIAALVSSGRSEPLCLNGPVIELDTTDLSRVYMPDLVRRVSRLLADAQAKGSSSNGTPR
jgi:predicted kinase